MPESRRDPVQYAAKKVSRGPSPLPVKAGAKGVSVVEGHRAKRAAVRSTAAPRVVDSDYSDNPSSGRGYRRVSNSPRTRGMARNRRAPRHSPNPRVGALMAEWLFGVVVISVTVPLQGAQNGYGKTITDIMFRLTGLTGFFFVLALMGNSQRAARFVVWFGLLVDLGILFTATTSGTFNAMTAVFKGQPITNSGGGGVVPAADVTSNQEPPSDIANATLPFLNSTSTTTPSGNAPIPA